jgi:hypothetical protein
MGAVGDKTAGGREGGAGRSMKTRIVLGIMYWVLQGAAVAADFSSVREFYAYPSLQYFIWEESLHGRRLLQEKGVLYSAGAAVAVDLLQTNAGVLTLHGKGELFGGVVDYDGQTQRGLPVNTEVSYVGTRVEGAIGWAVPLASGRLEPFAELGYRWWLRDIHNATTTDPNRSEPVQALGYTEHWESAYTKLGVAFSHRLDREWRLFAEAGGKYPFSNANTLHIEIDTETDTMTRTVTLKPVPRWSAFAELGARSRRFRLALFYEGYRVGQSPVKRIGPVGLLQPQSNEDIVGVSLAWCFR